MTDTTTQVQLDCSRTVNETVALHPATGVVFGSHGIDTCCGGGISVEEAARNAAIDPRQLCAELEAAARGVMNV